MGRLSGAASWIVKSLLTAFLMATYWFYIPPQNLLQSFAAVIFCFVTSWIIVRILQACFRA